MAIPHLAAIIWGLAMEFLPSVPCPLTPLEQVLLHKAGEEGYRGGFVDHYIVPLIYPEVTPHFFIAAGFFLLAVNCVIYALLIMRFRAKKAKPDHKEYDHLYKSGESDRNCGRFTKPAWLSPS